MKRRKQKIGGGNGSGTIMGGAITAILGSAGLLITFAVCLFLFSAFQPKAASGLRTMIADALSPALDIVSTPFQKASIFMRDITGLAEIRAENSRLGEENIKLREWYQTAMRLEAENKSLRELLNVKVEAKNKFITAKILSDSSGTFNKSLLVSAGQQDGVNTGQAVIAGDGLIGRVIEVGEHTSRILLITDIKSRVPVIIENTRQHAIFAGQNEHEGTLIHLPVESNVAEGARVTTSGIGGVFPTGLPLGIVKKVGDHTKEDLEGAVMVEPFANFNRLMHVRIVERPDIQQALN